MKSLVLLTILIASISHAQSLGLTDYLQQVQRNNPAYKAAVESTEGARLRKKEGSLLVMPTLLLQASQSVEEKDTLTPTINGTKSEYTNYKASISQNTTFGLNAKITYDQMYRDTKGADSTFIPKSEYYTANPYLEVTQSLWRNGFGSEVAASRDAINAAAEATQFSERYKVQGIEVDAQNTYMKLYYARKTLEAIKESLEVAGKIKGWTKKRSDRDLADKADYLQAKAAYELRQLDLLQATQDEKTVAREFNSLRGVESESVAEVLPSLPEPQVAKNLYDLKRSRDDIRAAQKQLEASKANSQLGKEKNKPTLDLFANYGHYSLDEKEGKAQSDSFKDDYPYYTVGIRFSTPLAFGTASDVREGYEKEVFASKLNVQRKMQEQERDYNDLVSRLETAQQKLKLATLLEESQKQKAQSERARQSKGRSTLFQALQFEQDYVNSRLNKIKTESELNALATQLQLYKEEK